MLAAQTLTATTAGQRHYHGADEATNQIHIHVGTYAIASIRQPGSLGLAILKELLNTHSKVPAHLRGSINLERDGFNLQVDSVPCSEEVRPANDSCALDWYFYAYCKAHKCPTKAAKIKVGGTYENNGMLTLQFQNGVCDHTNEEARAQQRKGMSTAKRKRSGRIAARTRTTTTTTTATTTTQQQDRSFSPLCSPKLEDTDSPGANQSLDTQGEGGVSKAVLTKEIEVSSAPTITSKAALMDRPNHSTGALCRDSNSSSPFRRTGRRGGEKAFLNKGSNQLTDRPRRSRITYRSGRYSTSRTARSTADASLTWGEPIVARQASPGVQVVIPLFSRIKPEPSHDHTDASEHLSSVSSQADESPKDEPKDALPRSTDAAVEAPRDTPTDPSKDEVLKASDVPGKVPSPSIDADNTGSIIVKQEVGHNTGLVHTSDNLQQHATVTDHRSQHPSIVSKPPLENRASSAANFTTEPTQPCRTILETQKHRSNLQQPSTHELSAQHQPNAIDKYTSPSTRRSVHSVMETHHSSQGGLLTPTPSLTSFEAVAQDPSSTSSSSVLSYPATDPPNPSPKPPPPLPQTCTSIVPSSGLGRLGSVSLRSPKKWLTQVPIAISPATTFEDLLHYVIREVKDSIQLPPGMRWSIRSLDLSQQYLLNARVAETITGVEHVALMIMTEQRADLHLDDF
ncbi:hypothetical protein EC968_003885 [Mortierella alpina]|nr:hypothetical protein EC968_003885 [Mortierella alpina]